MKPIGQTQDGPERGNCLQACVASLLELNLEDVPHFVLEEDWVEALDRWLSEFDLQSIDVDLARTRQQEGDMWKPLGYHLINGKSPRSNCQHAVVGYNGEIVHDPHWDNDGLETQETWTLFVKRFERIGE